MHAKHAEECVWHLRHAEKKDAQKLAAFARQAFIDKFGYLYRKEDLEAYLVEAYDVAEQERAIETEGNLHLLIMEGDEIIAFTKCMPCTLPIDTEGARAFELCRLYAKTGKQGLGLGQALMDRILQHCREVGWERVYVGVWEGNHDAQRFYQRNGFQEVGEYRFRVGTHFDRELIHCRDV